MNEDFLSQISKIKKSGKSYVVVTLVNVLGSAPQEVGARIIVGEEGLIYGTVGGGKVEAKVIETAIDLLKKEEGHLFTQWNLQKELQLIHSKSVVFL